MSWVDNENSHSNLFKSFEVRSTLLKCVDAMKTSTGLLKDAAKSLQESTFEQFLNSQSFDRLRSEGVTADDQLPREIQLLVIHLDKLRLVIREVLIETNSCLGQQKLAYSDQLKKLRDISNQAIRNAIQLERDNLQQKLLTYKSEREAKLIDEKDVLHQQLSYHKKSSLEAQNALATLQHQLVEQQAKYHFLTEEKVLLATERAQEQHKKDMYEHQVECRNRESSMKEEYNRLINNLEAQHKSNITDIKAANEKMIDLLSEEIISLKVQIEQSSHQKEKLLQDMSISRDSAIHALEQRNLENERSLRDQLAESYSAQANLKAEISVLHLKLKDELDSHRNCADQKEAQLRQALSSQHRVELEKLAERHKTRMHLLEAELQTQHEAELKRIKALHQQEIERLIREITRYKGLSVRKGYQSTSTLIPSPPTTSSLNESLEHDNSHDNDIAPDIYAKSSQGQIGSNARKVSSYLKQLDSYISSAESAMDDSLHYHVQLEEK